jgi:acyl carrier protein
VRESVVVVREDAPGDRRLVAYIVPNSVSIPNANGLRDFIKSRLPDYMVPSAFVELDALPLTPNGKVDRKALPALDYDRSQSEAEYVAPRSPVEEVVAGIWADVLKVERASVHDNFFELGGHSLLVAQVTSRLRDAFSVQIPLTRLFETPTICGLATAVLELADEPCRVEKTAQMMLSVARLSEDQADKMLKEVLWSSRTGEEP